MSKNIRPIAFVENNFKEKFGIPRQSGRAPSVLSKIIFLPEFAKASALKGLENFSHIWLIFGFLKTCTDNFNPLVRPPRLGGNEKVGVFASRSPFRPNGLGLSCVKIVEINLENENAPFIIVSGADILDKSPIYDIKPYVPHADCISDAIGGFSDKFSSHKLEVKFENGVDEILSEIDKKAIVECLADDPRPAYQNDQRDYGMTFGNYNIKFVIICDQVVVKEIEKH